MGVTQEVGIATTLERGAEAATGVAPRAPSTGQVTAVSRTAAQGGRKAVERFLRGQLRALAGHEAKLAEYRQAVDIPVLLRRPSVTFMP